MGNRLGNTWKLEEHMEGIIGNLVGTPESKKDLKNNKLCRCQCIVMYITLFMDSMSTLVLFQDKKIDPNISATLIQFEHIATRGGDGHITNSSLVSRNSVKIHLIYY
jgi:hypothetical protein